MITSARYEGFVAGSRVSAGTSADMEVHGVFCGQEPSQVFRR